MRTNKLKKHEQNRPCDGLRYDHSWIGLSAVPLSSAAACWATRSSVCLMSVTNELGTRIPEEESRGDLGTDTSQWRNRLVIKKSKLIWRNMFKLPTHTHRLYVESWFKSWLKVHDKLSSYCTLMKTAVQSLPPHSPTSLFCCVLTLTICILWAWADVWRLNTPSTCVQTPRIEPLSTWWVSCLSPTSHDPLTIARLHRPSLKKEHRPISFESRTPYHNAIHLGLGGIEKVKIIEIGPSKLGLQVWQV